MLTLRTTLLALSPVFLAAFGGTAGAAISATTNAALYAHMAAHPSPGECIEAELDLAPGDITRAEPPADTPASAQLRYSMRYNDVAEGWSWPDAPTEKTPDYFLFKYLPLGSETEERGSYQQEDKIGEPQATQIRWRYDYFLAFPNLADFAMPDSDEPGFVSPDTAVPPEAVKLRAYACLTAPVVRESTTFWKATHGNPVDFTLKKRYLIGRLQRIEFFDGRNGQTIATVLPAPHP